MITEESFVDFKCPYCGDTVSFPQDCVGLAQECPLCSETVVVPKDGSQVGRKLPLPLATPRLILRRFQAADWQDLLQVTSDEELFHYVEDRPMGEEEVIRWLEADSYGRLTTANHPFYLALELKQTSKLVGHLSLSLDGQRHRQAGLSVFVQRSCQRQGLATEAVTAVLAFCFAGIGLHRVTAACDRQNVAAVRLWEKAGLRREAEFRQDRWVNGEWVDTIWFGLLREEYQPTQNQAG